MNSLLKTKIKKYCKDNNLKIDLNKTCTNLENNIYKYSLIASTFAEHANRKIVNKDDYNITNKFYSINNNDLNFYNLINHNNNYISKKIVTTYLFNDSKFSSDFVELLTKDLNNNLDKYIIK